MKKTTTMGIRLPPDLRGLLEAAAEEHERSLNAEIIVRLRRTFVSGDPVVSLSDADLVHALLSRHPGEPFIIQIGDIKQTGSVT